MGDIENETSAKRMRGVARMKEVYGFAIDPQHVSGSFFTTTVDHLFGEVWDTDALSIRDRRLLTIGVIAALGVNELLDIQFQSALDRKELTPDQLRELVVHLAHYVGWPLATRVSEMSEKAIARYNEKASDTPTKGAR